MFRFQLGSGKKAVQSLPVKNQAAFISIFDWQLKHRFGFLRFFSFTPNNRLFGFFKRQLQVTVFAFRRHNFSGNGFAEINRLDNFSGVQIFSAKNNAGAERRHIHVQRHLAAADHRPFNNRTGLRQTGGIFNQLIHRARRHPTCCRLVFGRQYKHGGSITNWPKKSIFATLKSDDSHLPRRGND